MSEAKRLAAELVPKTSDEGEWLWILELRFVAERMFSGAIIAEREKCARYLEKMAEEHQELADHFFGRDPERCKQQAMKAHTLRVAAERIRKGRDEAPDKV